MVEIVIIAIVITLGLIAIAAIIIGAIAIFAAAAEQEFLGIAAYIALWVFLAPIMAVISFIIGLIILIAKLKESV